MGDPCSWKARGAAVRDARHVHNGPDVCEAPAKRKDTKRWCRGKVGVEHQLVVAVMWRFTLWPSLVRHCSACGKEFGTHSAYSWSKSHPPDWVTTDDLKALMTAKQQPRPEIRRG